MKHYQLFAILKAIQLLISVSAGSSSKDEAREAADRMGGVINRANKTHEDEKPTEKPRKIGYVVSNHDKWAIKLLVAAFILIGVMISLAVLVPHLPG